MFPRLLSSAFCYELDLWALGQALKVFSCVLVIFRPLVDLLLQIVAFYFLIQISKLQNYNFVLIYLEFGLDLLKTKYMYMNSSFSVITSRGQHCFCTLSQKPALLVITFIKLLSQLNQLIKSVFLNLLSASDSFPYISIVFSVGSFSNMFLRPIYVKRHFFY